MDTNKNGKGERIAIPSNWAEVSLTPEPKLQVATAIDYEGECTSEEDCDGYEWEQLCSQDIKIFSENAPIGEVSDYLDSLRLSNEHKLEILDGLFG